MRKTVETTLELDGLRPDPGGDMQATVTFAYDLPGEKQLLTRALAADDYHRVLWEYLCDLDRLIDVGGAAGDAAERLRDRLVRIIEQYPHIDMSGAVKVVTRNPNINWSEP